jgi:hypothetical protein
MVIEIFWRQGFASFPIVTIPGPYAKVGLRAIGTYSLNIVLVKPERVAIESFRYELA